MKTVGIIAEYNPFHTGHEYHIRKAKEVSGADYVIVVMSPDFVQRGEPAVFDKYTRAQMALRCGADLVLALPICYACASAEYFAQGAVALLHALGVTDILCFGAETDQLKLFRQTAQILLSEPADYKEALRAGLCSGLTFPQARSQALAAYSGLAYKNQTFEEFVKTPNNILGIEYCKALQRLESQIQPLPIRRRESEYHSLQMDRSFCSASALRSSILNNSEIFYETSEHLGHGAVQKKYGMNEKIASHLLKYIPESCRDLFLQKSQMPLYTEDFLPYLKLRLLEPEAHCEFVQSTKEVLDISSDLADRIAKLRFSCMDLTYEEIIAVLKTKQITETRIRRALLHLLLGIRTRQIENFRANGSIFYAQVLGLCPTASELLREIKKRSTVPLITKTANASKILEPQAHAMWEQDLHASHLYRSVQSAVYGIPFKTEYECSPICKA